MRMVRHHLVDSYPYPGSCSTTRRWSHSTSFSWPRSASGERWPAPLMTTSLTSSWTSPLKRYELEWLLYALPHILLAPYNEIMRLKLFGVILLQYRRAYVGLFWSLNLFNCWKCMTNQIPNVCKYDQKKTVQRQHLYFVCFISRKNQIGLIISLFQAECKFFLWKK